MFFTIIRAEKKIIGFNLEHQNWLSFTKYWIRRIHWIHVAILFGNPLIAIYGVMTTPLQTNTLIWSIIYYFITGLGITAGYHRLWSHKAYDAVMPVQYLIAVSSSGLTCPIIDIVALGFIVLHFHLADASHSHRSVTLTSGAVQGSAKWWCRHHRVHHRYTDTDLDPYSARSVESVIC